MADKCRLDEYGGHCVTHQSLNRQKCVDGLEEDVASLRASLSKAESTIAALQARVGILEGCLYRNMDPMDATKEDAAIWNSLPQAKALSPAPKPKSVRESLAERGKNLSDYENPDGVDLATRRRMGPEDAPKPQEQNPGGRDG